MSLSPRTLRAVVYGSGVPLDDPAETYHEASKAYPSFLAREVPGVSRLENDPQLQDVVARAVRRYSRRPRLPLPGPKPLAASLGDLVRRRRSSRSLDGGQLTLGEVATILDAAYGVTEPGEQPLRSVPSGGALYPLELYLVALDLHGLPSGLYHYDPLDHALERLVLGDLAAPVREAMVYPELADGAAVLVVTGLFWRTRFKYGLRGYRFALIEAGHVVQNLLLACTALDLPAVPIGGFYDRRLESLLGVDGVNESVLYGAAFGGRGSSR